MHSFTNRGIAAAFLVAASAALTACSDQAQSPTAATLPTPAAPAVSQDPQTVAANELGRLAALALGEPSARGIFFNATRGSRVVEGKLFLGGFLRGEGAAVLNAMARAGDVSTDHVLSLLAQTGPLEIYLPVEAHRAAWRGGSDLLVAVSLRDQQTPAGFDLNGAPVIMDRRVAPATPTVSITRAEAFDETGRPFARAAQNGPRASVQMAGKGPSRYTTSDLWTGFWVNYISIPGDFEDWYRGQPEYEFFVENASTRVKLRCADMDSMEPFRWDMNGTSYDADFLVAWQNETPTLEGMLLHVVEDDDTQCVIKDEKDYPKLAAEFAANSYSGYKAVGAKQYDQAVLSFAHAAVALWTIIKGEDQYVGSAMANVDVSGTETRLLLRNEAGQDKGYVNMQFKTDYGH